VGVPSVIRDRQTNESWNRNKGDKPAIAVHGSGDGVEVNFLFKLEGQG
jgi:hypothetical protein